MITNIQYIIKNQGWQQGQLVDTDFWMGQKSIKHVIRVLLIKDFVLFIEFDKEFSIKYKEVCNTEDSFVYDYKQSDFELIYASTQAEAINDASLMCNILEEKKQKTISKTKDAILKGISVIQNAHSDYELYQKAVEQLNYFQGEEFKDFRKLLLAADYYKYNPDNVESDVNYIIRLLYQERGFCYRDVDNNNIWTYVNLNQAVSIETGCEDRGKECVCIKMVSGDSFNVYKEHSHDLYVALDFLY